jgi:hypothetical protein
VALAPAGSTMRLPTPLIMLQEAKHLEQDLVGQRPDAKLCSSDGAWHGEQLGVRTQRLLRKSGCARHGSEWRGARKKGAVLRVCLGQVEVFSMGWEAAVSVIIVELNVLTLCCSGIMRGPAATLLLLLAVAAAGLRPSRAARAVRVLAAWQHSQKPACSCRAPM